MWWHKALNMMKLNAYTCNMDEQVDFIKLNVITDLYFQSHLDTQKKG